MKQSKKFIYTDGFNELEDYLFKEVKYDDDVTLISKNRCFKNKLIYKMFRLHFSFRINRLINLPFKQVWYPFLDKNKNNDSACIYIFMASWYYPSFYKYIKKKHPNAKLILYFGDTVISKQRNIFNLKIEDAKKITNEIYSYNPKDVREYSLKYLPMCYSKDDDILTSQVPKWDVVFIGAARNRYQEIVESYNHCKDAGLKVLYIVVGKKLPQSKELDFIVSETPISMKEYLKHVSETKCIWEIIDPESEGSTLRFWDAVIYDKFLISNNKFVKESSYYTSGNIIYYENVNEVSFSFLKEQKQARYMYSGDNSPRHFLNQISSDLRIDASTI